MALIDLRIDDVVMHLIQRSTKAAAAGPVLSEALAPLDGQSRGFLEERVREALKRARPVVEDTELEAATPGVLRSYLSGESDLLAASIKLAMLLQATQAGNSPAGIMLAAHGELGGSPIFVLAKFEHEVGARAQQQQTSDGKTVYGMQFLQDLFMTRTSRVYKVAIFEKGPDFAKDSLLTGQVVDQQSTGASVAGYFISTFLGCRFTERADVLTEKFHNAAVEFFAKIPDAARRTKYQVALLSELNSHRSTISVPAFARDFLDPEDRDDFVAEVTSKAPSLSKPIPKDVSLVRNRLLQVRVEFKSSAILLAPPDEIGAEGTITIDQDQSGVSDVHIRDAVTEVSGYGRVPQKPENSGGSSAAE